MEMMETTTSNSISVKAAGVARGRGVAGAGFIAMNMGPWLRANCFNKSWKFSMLKEPGQIGVLAEESIPELGHVRTHAEIREIKPRAHGATDQRIVTGALGSLPNTGGDDVKGRESRGDRTQSVGAGFEGSGIDRAQTQRAAIEESPEFVGSDIMPAADRSLGQ